MRRTRPLAAALLVSVAAALAACATPTGPAAYDSFDAYEGERVNLSGYDAVYVAPVTAAPEIVDRIDANPIGPTNRIRPIGAEDLAEQQERFAEQIANAVSDVAVLRDAPGPGVLTIEAELTQLQANRPTMAEFSANPALDFRSISIGAAAARITLSEDGRPIGVISDEAPQRQINDPGVGVRIWGTADLFYQRTADKLAALLRQAS